MRKFLLILGVLAIAAGGWLWWSGGLNRVTESRVEDALLDSGVPPRLAGCMAPKMVDRLSLNQLRKLERLGPRDDEAGLPQSPFEGLARLRRVDDSEAVRVLVAAAGSCAFDVMLESR